MASKSSRYTHRTIASGAYLWIYSSITGKLQKINDINVCQILIPVSELPTGQYVAVNEYGLDRLVSGEEKTVWYFPRKYEYLIWSTVDNESEIKNILMRSIRERTTDQVNTCLESLQKNHDILETASINLLTNCVFRVRTYDEVKDVIDQYFFSL